jgi:hypothetical protein
MPNLTIKNITFLSDINKSYYVDKTEKYYYFRLNNLDVDNINNFIINIKDNQSYLIFPFITTTQNPDDPYLRLSNQFLINNQSNANLISKFLENQWAKSDFDLIEVPKGLY